MSATGGRRGVAAVTGAAGFVGRHVAEQLHAQGWAVRGLVRDTARYPFRSPGIELFACDLPDRIDERAFGGVDAVVHCAWATRPASPDEARRVNEQGTQRILAASRAAEVAHFVFVSSTSAHEDALSYYGRSKLAGERRLDPTRDLVLRVGLVLGSDGGLFQRIAGTLRRGGIVPLFDGGRQPLQTVHIDDLCTAIARALDRRLAGRYVVAEPEPLSVRELFRLTAARMGRRCLLVPVPAAPVLFVLRVSERLGLKLPVSSENLLGLQALRVQPSQADLEALGVRLRSAAESLELLLG